MEKAKSAGSRRTVVLIEDDEFIAAALRDLLEFNGYEVIATTTLKQATTALSGVDGRCLVLLDPLVAGVTANSVLRALQDNQALITIAMAVYPFPNRNDPPGKTRQNKRLISPELLLEMVKESFSDDTSACLDRPIPLAA